MIATLAIQLAQARWDDHMGWDGGWWIVMVLGMILVTGLIILGAYLIVRELTGRGPTGGSDETDAMAILDRRLAAGEISPEEYRERRAVLRE